MWLTFTQLQICEFIMGVGRTFNNDTKTKLLCLQYLPMKYGNTLKDQSTMILPSAIFVGRNENFLVEVLLLV